MDNSTSQVSCTHITSNGLAVDEGRVDTSQDSTGEDNRIVQVRTTRCTLFVASHSMPRPAQQVEIHRSLVPQPDVIIENNYWGHCTCCVCACDKV